MDMYVISKEDKCTYIAIVLSHYLDETKHDFVNNKFLLDLFTFECVTTFGSTKLVLKQQDKVLQFI